MQSDMSNQRLDSNTKQDGPGTEPEPETGTVRTVFQGTERWLHAPSSELFWPLTLRLASV